MIRKILIVLLSCVLSLIVRAEQGPSTSSSPVLEVIDGFLKGLGVSGIDVDTCAGSLYNSEQAITVAIDKFQNKEIGEGVDQLGVFAHELSVAVGPCNVGQVPSLLDQLSKALHLSKVKWIDDVVSVWISGSKDELNIEKIVSDWESQDYNSFGVDMASFVEDIKNMLHCHKDDQVCIVLQSILAETISVLPDFGECEANVADLKKDLEIASQGYEAEDMDKVIDGVVAFIEGLGSVIAPCHLRDLARLLHDTSSKLKTAKITTHYFGEPTITVGPVDLSNILKDLLLAWKERDYEEVGLVMTKLVTILRTYNCDSKMCTVVDGLLRAFGILAYDMKDCKNYFNTAENDFDEFVKYFKSEEYKTALVSLQKGSEALSQGVSACQLKSVASLIDEEAKKLNLGDVSIVDDVVHIIIEGNDIFSSVDAVVNALESKDYDRVGNSLMNLVNEIQSTVCSEDDKTCVIAEGILETIEIYFYDLGECKTDLKASLIDVENALEEFHEGKDKAAIVALGDSFKSLSSGVKNCHLDELADVISAQGSKIGIANVEIVEEVVKVLIEGSDVYDDIYSATTAVHNGDYKSFGRSIGALIKDSHVATCNSPICKFLTSALRMVSIIAPDFTACEADLQAAWADLELVGNAMKDKKYSEAIKALSRSLDTSAKGIQSCDLEKESTMLAQLADQLGLHQIGQDIEGVIGIFINGENIADELANAGSKIVVKDYEEAGLDIGKAIQILMKWHYSHSCETPVCFVLEGMTQALGVVETNFAMCENDVSSAWISLVKSINDLKQHDAFTGSTDGKRKGTMWNEKGTATREYISISDMSDGAILLPDYFIARSLREVDGAAWWYNIKDWFKSIALTIEDDVEKDWSLIIDKLHLKPIDLHVKQAMIDLSTSLDELAHGLHDCHAEKLAAVLGKVAVELGYPNIGWLDTAFNLIINGAQVYDDAYNAVVDYEQKNYFGMGYEMAKLAVLIVQDINY
jgi:hypothetical protein